MKFHLVLICLIVSQIISAQTPGDGLTDIDGNEYQTVIIGDQEWMAENLKTSHYNNGDPIPNVIDNSIWDNLETGAWCYYNNDISNDPIYGKLYNWYAVDDNRQLCPSGWKIPSNEDFVFLVEFLGGTWEAGAKLKEEGLNHWNSPNNGAVNEYGFTALPGGVRDDGVFEDIGDYGYLWDTWDDHPTTRKRWEMRHTQTIFADFNTGRREGYSCRCLKSTPLKLNDFERTNVSVFPNPFQSEFNIKITPDKIGSEFKIIDGYGRILHTGKLSTDINKVNINHMTSGIYYLQVAEIVVTMIKN